MDAIFNQNEEKYVSPDVEIICITKDSPIILASGEGGQEGGEHGGWTPTNP